MNATRIHWYCEIAQGSILIAMFVTVLLAMYDMIPDIPFIVSSSPAPIMTYLTPISQGDMLIIMLITAYGAIWGLRLISAAMDGLRELNAIEEMIARQPIQPS